MDTAKLTPSFVNLPAVKVRSRVAGLGVLAVTALLLVGAARSVYFMVTDSWVAPIHLSRDNEQVLQLQLKLNREEGEMARVEADVQRIDGDLAAVDMAIKRLGELRDRSSAPLTWQADVTTEEQKTYGRVIAGIKDEVKVLERLHARQAELTAAARRDLEAGLIDRRQLQQHEQTLDGLEVSLAEKRRMIEETRQKERLATSRADAFRAGTDAPHTSAGLMPEIAASKEHASRVEVELLRLEAERRSLTGLRRVAAEGLSRQREILAELQARPLYRAMHTSTDIAFVPYDQLENVRPGARVMACTWGLILCEQVGSVAEVVPGEVATQDPWGEMARGQYAVLELSDQAAIRERVLRIRD